jgi:hypothetical protein
VSTSRKESDRAECERKLDQALDLTFPASDPIAVGRPTSTELAMRPALSERVLPTRKHRNVKRRSRLPQIQSLSSARCTVAEDFNRTHRPILSGVTNHNMHGVRARVGKFASTLSICIHAVATPSCAGGVFTETGTDTIIIVAVAGQSASAVTDQLQPAIITCRRRGPCAPRISVCSISAEREGPVIRLIARGNRSAPNRSRRRASTLS